MMQIKFILAPTARAGCCPKRQANCLQSYSSTVLQLREHAQSARAHARSGKRLEPAGGCKLQHALEWRSVGLVRMQRGAPSPVLAPYLRPPVARPHSACPTNDESSPHTPPGARPAGIVAPGLGASRASCQWLPCAGEGGDEGCVAAHRNPPLAPLRTRRGRAAGGRQTALPAPWCVPATVGKRHAATILLEHLPRPSSTCGTPALVKSCTTRHPGRQTQLKQGPYVLSAT